MDDSAVDEQQPPEVPQTKAPVPSSRAARARFAVAMGVVLLVVVLVFIIENMKSVSVTFFGASWKLPLAIDLLFAAVLGAVAMFLLGTVRIFQLRRVARHRIPRAFESLGSSQVAVHSEP